MKDLILHMLHEEATIIEDEFAGGAIGDDVGTKDEADRVTGQNKAAIHEVIGDDEGICSSNNRR